jgi:hypothetical protein
MIDWPQITGILAEYNRFKIENSLSSNVALWRPDPAERAGAQSQPAQ